MMVSANVKICFRIAFADIEGLKTFAETETSGIPVISDKDADFYLLNLSDYLKVYTASFKDGYRKDVKNKQNRIRLT